MRLFPKEVIKKDIPPWIQEIVSTQKKESNKIPSRWIQLSTIGLDNSPRVRTVVFRGWNKEHEMQIFTDKRSEKFKEIEINNNVEICWLFPKSKSQFRFRGRSKIEMGEKASWYWEKLSPNSKSLWAWPTPGELYEKESFSSNEIKDSPSKSSNFVVLEIVISQVDYLFLQKPIHMRKRWLRDSNWLEERINP